MPASHEADSRAKQQARVPASRRSLIGAVRRFALPILIVAGITGLAYEAATRFGLPAFGDLRSLPPALQLAIAALLLASIVTLTPAAFRTMLRWGRRRELLSADVACVTGAVSLTGIALLAPLQATWRATFGTVAALLGAAVLIRAVVRKRTVDVDRRGDRSASLFWAVLGEDGFEALSSLGDDELGRTPFVNALEGLVSLQRRNGLTLGLNGPWGSGKTTLLNTLAKRLKSRGFLVVRFDAWHFREPERLVEAYFHSLTGVLRDWAYLPGLRRIARQFASGLAALGGGRSQGVFSSLFAVSSRETVDELRADLSEALEALDRPVVVLVDDLDRLDPDELAAVIRAIRLVSDLRVTHVLAYDRSELAASLFQNDPSGDRARDYLAKVVNIELALPEPPRDLVLHLLSQALAPLSASIGADRAAEFTERIRASAPYIIARALRTPREVRRIAAATAWKWDHLVPHVNLADLFLLTIIQHRFPALYSTMHTRPEWFVRLEWSGFDAAFNKERYEEEATAYFEELGKDPRGSGAIALRILAALLPGQVKGLIVSGTPDEPLARAERRLMHPDVYPRYFQLGLLPGELAEADVEAAAAAIVAAPAGTERQALTAKLLREHIERNQVRSFLEQWSAVTSALAVAGGDAPYHDVAVGIAMASDQLPGDPSDFFSPLDSAESIVMNLISKLSSDDAATETLIEIIEKGGSLALVGTVVFYAADAGDDRRRGAYGNRRPDAVAIRSALDDEVHRRYASGPGPLVTGSVGDLVTIAYRLSPSVGTPLILRDIESDGTLLPRLLELALKLHSSSLDPSGFEAFSQEFGAMAERIDLAAIDHKTRGIPLSAWPNREDAEIVRRFRAWIDSSHPADAGA